MFRENKRVIEEEIESIEKVENFNNEYVYDIIMKDPSTPFFFANDILVHNSQFFNTKEILTNKLNNLIKKWALEKYGKKDITIKFDYKGYFSKLFLLAKCRYYGYLVSNKGTEEEMRGIEAKRSNSSKYEGPFQKSLLNKILDKSTLEDTNKFIEEEKTRFKTLPIEEVSFPAKLSNKGYDKNNPIFKRAIENTQKYIKDFKVVPGEVFYYIYTKRPIDVMAFKLDHMDFIKREDIDWDKMIERNIDNKTQNIFEAKKWQYNSKNQLTLL